MPRFFYDAVAGVAAFILIGLVRHLWKKASKAWEQFNTPDR